MSGEAASLIILSAAFPGQLHCRPALSQIPPGKSAAFHETPAKSAPCFDGSWRVCLATLHRADPDIVGTAWQGPAIAIKHL